MLSTVLSTQTGTDCPSLLHCSFLMLHSITALYTFGVSSALCQYVEMLTDWTFSETLLSEMIAVCTSLSFMAVLHWSTTVALISSGTDLHQELIRRRPLLSCALIPHTCTLLSLSCSPQSIFLLFFCFRLCFYAVLPYCIVPFLYLLASWSFRSNFGGLLSDWLLGWSKTWHMPQWHFTWALFKVVNQSQNIEEAVLGTSTQLLEMHQSNWEKL